MSSRLSILTVGVATVLSGCAMTSSYSRGPHGGAVHMIDGMSAGVAYKKADQLCPNGYDIISQQGQTSVVDYMMTVECKVQPQVNSAPVGLNTSVAAAPQQTPDYAAMVLSAQKLSTQMGCGDVKAAGGTTFQAQCSSYQVVIDCNSGTCRPVHTVNNQ